MWRGLVYVLAKEPRAGAVKTRLCPPLTQAQACRLARAFAADTLGALVGLRESARIEIRLALDDEKSGSDPELTRCANSGSDPDFSLRSVAAGVGIAVEDQGDGDLGARMARLVERGLAAGRPTILVGTDSPDMPPEMLRAAVRALRSVDVVVAPAEDGGYVLVGARRTVRELFEIDAPWSGPQVFDATCRALRHAGCAFQALPAWDDVDDAAGLRRLVRRLDESDGRAAPESARLLAQWKREGVRF